MTAAAEIPIWLGIIVGVLLVFGSTLTLLGTIGALILNSFYDRVHPPTLGATLGGACVLIASVLFHSVREGRFAMQELLLLAFLFITSPVTLLLIVRAGLHRDRVEGRSPVPEFDALDDAPPPANPERR